MDLERMIDKVKVNGARDAMFEPYEVYNMLVDAGEDWRIIWEELPTLGLFDHLYAESGNFSAFIYQDTFFERKHAGTIATDEYYWEIFTQEGQLFIDWILDHPPFDCCVAIADLYRHAQNMQAECSPWVLFENITGYRHDDDVTPYLNIGVSDAVMIGRALECWGEFADVVDPYIHLLIHYSR